MLEDTVKDLKADGVPLKPAVSKVPIEDWVDLLEAGWRLSKKPSSLTLRCQHLISIL